MIDLDPDIEWIEWDFEPYTTDYAQYANERIFVTKWQKMMMDTRTGVSVGHKRYVDPYFVDNYPSEFPILKVLPYRRPDAHDTRLASTFIHSLSRGVLRFLPDEATRYMVQNHLSAHEAYLLAWSLRNVRALRGEFDAGFCFRNVPRDHISAEFNGKTQSYSARDNETLEQMVLWLATDEGRKFLQECNHEVMSENNRSYRGQSLDNK